MVCKVSEPLITTQLAKEPALRTLSSAYVAAPSSNAPGVLGW
jgi:hypothetical protein